MGPGIIFWILYLPLSMWAMQTNWNGLFLAEPRWRLGVVFALGGLILQTGLSLVDEPAWASAGNIAYLLVLGLALQKSPRGHAPVFHPSCNPAPGRIEPSSPACSCCACWSPGRSRGWIRLVVQGCER